MLRLIQGMEVFDAFLAPDQNGKYWVMAECWYTAWSFNSESPHFLRLSHTQSRTLASYLSKSSTRITVSGLGTKTCLQIQNLADDNDLFPDECGAVQVRTLTTSDPCGCKKRGGGDCEPPGFTNTQQCNLCGGNKRIGDPYRIIQNGILDGSACIDVFDDNKYGAFVSVCSAAQNLVKKYCKCVSPGDAVKQCIPIESQYCDPNDDSDVCCSGSCKYLTSKGGYRCTERPGNTPPSNNAPPKGVQYVPCFSGEVTVLTEDKRSVLMRDLVVGDKVLTGSGTYEPVYSFGHKHDFIMATYLKIKTDQDNPLEISPEHMVFISQDHSVPAGILKQGDTLLLSNGERTTIRSIDTIDRHGMYAPFTLSGRVVVNGIVASSYVSMQPTSEYLLLGKSLSTPFTIQWLAHAFEAPHRLAYRLGIAQEGHTKEGVSFWVKVPMQIATWLVQQNAVVMGLLMIPALAIFGIFWCLEQHLLTSIVVFAFLLVVSNKRSLKTRNLRFVC